MNLHCGYPGVSGFPEFNWHIASKSRSLPSSLHVLDFYILQIHLFIKMFLCLLSLFCGHVWKWDKISYYKLNQISWVMWYYYSVPFSRQCLNTRSYFIGAILDSKESCGEHVLRLWFQLWLVVSIVITYQAPNKYQDLSRCFYNHHLS